MSQEVKDNTNLDAPLVVHKKSDASYNGYATDVEMNDTIVAKDTDTLVRHRFKKDKTNKSKGKYFVLLGVFVVIAILCGLYFSGSFAPDNDDATTTTQPTTESTTTLQQKYKDTIVVKDVYIFIDGEEVNGIQGLQDAIKYKEASDTKYSIIKEHANTDFFNYEVLSVLETLGFYSENTVITTVQSTGLIAQAEIVTESFDEPVVEESTQAPESVSANE